MFLGCSVMGKQTEKKMTSKWKIGSLHKGLRLGVKNFCSEGEGDLRSK